MTTQIPPTGQARQTSDGGVGSATEQAKEKAQEIAGQAKEQAGGRVREQVDQRSTEFGQRISSQASDARSVAEELRRQGKDQPARLAEQAAEKAERVGGWLERSDADTILRDAEDFGRKRPWAVVAGGLALGLAASRFLKASSAQRARGGGGPSYPRQSNGGGAIPQSTGVPSGTTGGL
jgi:ElaB/YqjD/DUF883 family membrane-anchored ribosome-binding protein